jgi:hypothetical protein
MNQTTRPQELDVVGKLLQRIERCAAADLVAVAVENYRLKICI